MFFSQFIFTRRGSTRRFGFTLVELLGVVAVVVLLLAFTLPVLRGGQTLGQVGVEVSGVLEAARAHAMAQNTRVWVGFHEGGSERPEAPLTIYVVAAADGTNDPAQANLTWLRTSRFQSIRLTDLADASYNPRSGPAADYLQLADAASVTMTLPASLSRYNTGSKVVRFDPDGAVRLVTTTGPGEEGTLSRWVEVGLQRARGGVLVSSDAEKESAVVQLAGLTGKAALYLP